MGRQPVPWAGSFEVDGARDAGITVTQIDHKLFELGSTVRYVGARTGLEDELPAEVVERIRRVGPDSMPTTDLTSVPHALRWFVSPYGPHTPAALLHDALIGPRDDEVSDQQADRYFRFMLQDLGVPWIRRWLMWAAVALRTRYCAEGLRRWLIVVWVLASMLGMGTAAAATVTGHWPLLLAAALAPLVFATLWGKQYGAGVAAAYTAPWVLPPTAFGAAGFFVYQVLEALAGRFVDRDRPARTEQPTSYEAF